ncbi:ADP-ribosylglycohydrolase, partial [Tothia fuscella]
MSKQEAAVAYPPLPNSIFRFSLADHGGTSRLEDARRCRFIKRHWTDDTDHALLILLSYLHKDGQICPQDFAQRLRIWIYQGTLALDTVPVGLGAHTASVLTAKNYATNPAAAAHNVWLISKYQSAPNGALMRIHPLGAMTIVYTLDRAFQLAAENAMTTHSDPRCIISCVIAVGIIRGLIRGEVNTEDDIYLMIERAITWYKDWRVELEMTYENHDIRALDPVLNEDELHKWVSRDIGLSSHTFLSELTLDDPKGMGYTSRCLESGILLLRYA